MTLEHKNRLSHYMKRPAPVLIFGSYRAILSLNYEVDRNPVLTFLWHARGFPPSGIRFGSAAPQYHAPHSLFPLYLLATMFVNHDQPYIFKNPTLFGIVSCGRLRKHTALSELLASSRFQ